MTQREPERQAHHERLERYYQPASVNPVAKHPADRSDDDAGQGADPANADYQQRRPFGAESQIAHQPAKSEQLEPVRGIGKEVAHPHKAVIPVRDPGIERLRPGQPPKSSRDDGPPCSRASARAIEMRTMRMHSISGSAAARLFAELTRPYTARVIFSVEILVKSTRWRSVEELPVQRIPIVGQGWDRPCRIRPPFLPAV